MTTCTTIHKSNHHHATKPPALLLSCIFNGCNRPAALSQDSTVKCAFHWHRARCLASPTCFNQVFARHRCVRHGGRKQCSVDGCYLNARLGTVCSKHGASAALRQCTYTGCTTRASARKKCIRHGGGRACRASGCTAHARTRGYCRKHSPRLVDQVADLTDDDAHSATSATLALHKAEVDEMANVLIKEEVLLIDEPIDFAHPLDPNAVDGWWWIEPDVASELLELLTVQDVHKVEWKL
ncbi:hypothetical protein H257_15250 [Aphanomyces astaci]|uniref:Uncharacterized protein n=1 Tax=Aphanomyces astaci TaxID=112090 RepID=W4FQE6_APHAT|nr:hypothetical protein H257_15250 [Aphanomyces astaci]ETV68903.1 hypothetical protein H257_15250 [Aphanomyces astaci]|eukprot:XP_009841580.1 hypothetical protein H257_15250 [Aphanomyces astaci]